jgi:hypothetical protein
MEHVEKPEKADTRDEAGVHTASLNNHTFPFGAFLNLLDEVLLYGVPVPDVMETQFERELFRR